ncbi:hypothetical protein BT69DRAFT_476464 [Atractiella rhizophila]|nr:hypothetical protein BT69DRAFT_476464 [Atractiella rhizophila]
MLHAHLTTFTTLMTTLCYGMSRTKFIKIKRHAYSMYRPNMGLTSNNVLFVLSLETCRETNIAHIPIMTFSLHVICNQSAHYQFRAHPFVIATHTTNSHHNKRSTSRPFNFLQY